jgi:phosphotransferase system HPr (HPr) family protein
MKHLSEIKQTVRLLNKVGLHARPAAMFVQTANTFKSEIKVDKEGKEVDAKSILGILSLAVECNDEVTIKANGEDAEDAIRKLVDLVNSKFGEE